VSVIVRMVLALAVGVVLSVGVARAQEATGPATHDVQAWLLLVALIPIGEQWTLQTEVQPRWKEDLSERHEAIVRGSVGRRLGRRATLWGGVATVARWTDGQRADDEQRVWQQLSTTFPNVGKWTPSIRIRVEQRFLDAWQDSSHRLRTMARLTRPLGASRWTAALWNEYFVTLDDTRGGPQQGFDQNRVMATVIRPLGKRVTLESGYVWQFVSSTATRAPRHGHTLFTWLTYTAGK